MELFQRLRRRLTHTTVAEHAEQRQTPGDLGSDTLRSFPLHNTTLRQRKTCATLERVDYDVRCRRIRRDLRPGALAKVRFCLSAGTTCLGTFSVGFRKLLRRKMQHMFSAPRL